MNFWLSFDDFMDNFKMVHICRIFQKPFSHQYSLNGEWIGKTACGRAVESETTLTKVGTGPQMKKSNTFFSDPPHDVLFTTGSA